MSEIWSIIQTNFIVLMMVLVRTTGIFSFSPIFSRRGVPNNIKAGVSFVIALLITMSGDFSYYTVPAGGLFPFMFDIAKELLVGAILGVFTNLMLQAFGLAGDIVDMQIGLSMGKAYDPTYGNAGVTTQFYNSWFILYFFAVGAHETYIELFATSYEHIPLGYSGFNLNMLYVIPRFFQSVLELGLKLSMPIIVTELVTEFCIGVLMKAVPTIHVFVLNIQLKLLVGLVVLTASCGVIGEFIEMLTDVLFENLDALIRNFTSPAALLICLIFYDFRLILF